MRIFHTKTNVCGVSQDVHAGAIGRLLPSCEPIHSLKKTPPLSHRGQKTYYGESKHDAMLKSLREGNLYYQKQLSALSRVEFLLRQLSRESTKDLDYSTSDNRYTKRNFYHQSLVSLSSESFKSFPVFGYGHESPMRIHLRLENKRITKLLTPSPLLTKAAFRSVLLTLGLDQGSIGGNCVESVSEVLNLMISAKSFEEELSALTLKIANQANIVGESLSHKPQQTPGFFRSLKMRIYKSLITRMPRPMPEVPI